MTAPTAPTLDVDWTACRAHGLCAELLPDHVTPDEWGYPLFEKGPVPGAALERTKRAAADCPVLALKLGAH
ncbi:ferredoxin [Streptomyces europaeiscabiei]|uniref:ferredoxin n=1 Tax=Streptomyces europaeiscabiei TaxID=146819 RepID=UPI0029BA9D7A|nr:ferredoxin [Streptomyces europaeiscabiei]MDX2763686.1 ferredoxin [Streptomyces europaeiscabiei]MDX2772038.1 ferredoxin [Streptomyces europaeiscabiei]MDX3846372.1 ferredoxin [Streptomyces europaeiscabiei]MDX3865563.1 ferredoxin [Streptomyces europaeiscabiei]MDX3874988.1 ferredoxin [Streptomyces europaeiscabiei]